MKIDTKTETTPEKTENIVRSEAGDNEILQNLNMPFAKLLDEKSEAQCDNGMLQGAAEVFAAGDMMLMPDLKIDAANISENDAKFFLELTQNAQFFAMPGEGNNFSLVKAEPAPNGISARAVEVTNKITELIAKAKDTQKPVRIDFDNNISVVLKIDKHGKVSAEFIPGSLEAESFLRSNIASLRQRFDEQNLPYNELYYRNNGGGKNKKQKR